jgi:DNA-binding transcriptional LysR family regulator
MISELLQRSGLSFDRLQSFCLVAEAGGVTKAAKGDPAKQSLYSRQVRELEEFFGAELIRRRGRGIVLTEAGASLHAVARESFTALTDFKSECQGRPIEIVIGTGDSLIQWLLLPRLKNIRQQIPRARFKFLNLPTDEAVKRLADGLIDFALVREDAVARPVQAAPLGVLGYSLFIPETLEPPARPKEGVKLLDGLPLATIDGEGSFRAALAEIARKQKIRVNIQIECSSFPMAARAVIKGEMAAILPSIAAAELENAGAIEVPLDFLRHFDRKICLCSNARSLRIRPILQRVGESLARLCHF